MRRSQEKNLWKSSTKYKNPAEESDKNVSETAEKDAETEKNIQENVEVETTETEAPQSKEVSETEVKEDSETKTEEANTSTFSTGYAQWVEMMMKNNSSGFIENTISIQ